MNKEKLIKEIIMVEKVEIDGLENDDFQFYRYK